MLQYLYTLQNDIHNKSVYIIYHTSIYYKTLLIGSLYLLTPLTNFAYPPNPPGNLHFILCTCEFHIVCFCFQIPRVSEIIWYFSFSDLFYLA